MNTKNSQRGSAKLIPIIAGVAVLIAGGGYMYYSKDNSTSDETYTKDATAQKDTTPLPPIERSAGITVTDRTDSTSTDGVLASYKDGTWSAEGSYAIPEEGKTEKIGVSLTLKDGVVVDSSVTGMGIERESKKYQGIFIQNYKEYVEGKNINDIVVGKVSGSSLTGKGFTDALEKIKVEAKS